MFRIGDKVIDAYWIGEEDKIVTGTIYGHHRGHYLVRWEGKSGRGWYTHRTEKDLLPVDSPAALLLADVHRKIRSLAGEIERLRAEAETIVRSAKGKRTKGRQAGQAE